MGEESLPAIDPMNADPTASTAWISEDINAWTRSSTDESVHFSESPIDAPARGEVSSRGAASPDQPFFELRRADILWHNPEVDQIAVWLMNGTAPSSSAVVLSDPNWVVTHIGDTNGDGKSDLLWRSSAIGATDVWLMNGLTFSASGSLLTDPSWTLSPADGL